MKDRKEKKVRKGITLSRTLFTVFLLVAVFSSAPFFYLAGQAASPSMTITVADGVYPGAPSYTVYQVSGYTYAKDQNGVNEFGGSDAATVINSAIANGGGVFISQGTYEITETILIEEDHTKIIGDQRGTVIFSWVGSAGGSVIATGETPYIYDVTIENIDIHCNDEANAIYLKPALRFTIRDVNIVGGTSANTYSGIVLDATYGNVGWGLIDNVFMDYVGYAINVFGTDASHVVTDFQIGRVWATNVKYAGLRFAQWCDSIDVDYGFFSSGADNSRGIIFNDGANPDSDNGVYDIHVNRVIFDNWHYANTYTIYMKTCKQIVIDSAFKGNSTDSFADISGYAVSFYIVEQGQNTAADNGINIYYRNMTSTEVPP